MALIGMNVVQRCPSWATAAWRWRCTPGSRGNSSVAAAQNAGDRAATWLTPAMPLVQLRTGLGRVRCGGSGGSGDTVGAHGRRWCLPAGGDVLARRGQLCGLPRFGRCAAFAGNPPHSTGTGRRVHRWRLVRRAGRGDGGSRRASTPTARPRRPRSAVPARGSSAGPGCASQHRAVRGWTRPHRRVRGSQRLTQQQCDLIRPGHLVSVSLLSSNALVGQPAQPSVPSQGHHRHQAGRRHEIGLVEHSRGDRTGVRKLVG